MSAQTSEPVLARSTKRLLQPERLEEILATGLDRRQERTERRREHVAELNKRAAETELRLKRLYDAIESGIADLDDPDLKERIAGLKAIRDQAQIDAERTHAMLESPSQQAITPAMVHRFARTARELIRIAAGGYHRDHLRALAQRVEVADKEVRIMGSKSDRLRTLVAASSVKPATAGVRSSVLKRRREGDWGRALSGRDRSCLSRRRAPPSRAGEITRTIIYMLDSFHAAVPIFQNVIGSVTGLRTGRWRSVRLAGSYNDR